VRERLREVCSCSKSREAGHKDRSRLRLAVAQVREREIDQFTSPQKKTRRMLKSEKLNQLLLVLKLTTMRLRNSILH